MQYMMKEMQDFIGNYGNSYNFGVKNLTEQ